jgi:hypothetical protein
VPRDQAWDPYLASDISRAVVERARRSDDISQLRAGKAENGKPRQRVDTVLYTSACRSVSPHCSKRRD